MTSRASLPRLVPPLRVGTPVPTLCVIRVGRARSPAHAAKRSSGIAMHPPELMWTTDLAALSTHLTTQSVGTRVPTRSVGTRRRPEVHHAER